MIRRLINWVLPDDIWKDFYLDNIVYVKAGYDINGGFYAQWVFREFWEQIKDIYGKDTEE